MKKYLYGASLLMGALTLGDYAQAEMKVTGSIEQTFKSVKNGNSALGNETNVTFTGKKSLDNGIDLKGKINLEDNEVDKSSLKFIKDNDAFDMLEKRVSKTAVRAYIDMHNTVPAGVNFGTKLGVNVRKPTTKEE